MVWHINDLFQCFPNSFLSALPLVWRFTKASIYILPSEERNTKISLNVYLCVCAFVCVRVCVCDLKKHLEVILKCLPSEGISC